MFKGHCPREEDKNNDAKHKLLFLLILCCLNECEGNPFCFVQQFLVRHFDNTSLVYLPESL